MSWTWRNAECQGAATGAMAPMAATGAMAATGDTVPTTGDTVPATGDTVPATGGKPDKPVKCGKTGPTIYDNGYVVGVVVEQCPYPLFLSPVYLTSPSWG